MLVSSYQLSQTTVATILLYDCARQAYQMYKVDVILTCTDPLSQCTLATLLCLYVYCDCICDVKFLTTISKFQPFRFRFPFQFSVSAFCFRFLFHPFPLALPRFFVLLSQVLSLHYAKSPYLIDIESVEPSCSCTIALTAVAFVGLMDVAFQWWGDSECSSSSQFQSSSAEYTAICCVLPSALVILRTF